MRFSLVLLCLGWQLICLSSTHADIHSLLRRATDAPAQRPHPAIARIEVLEPDAVSFGSGTLIGVDDTYGWVITNWHVVRGATDKVLVTFPDGHRTSAVVMKTDEDWDLALLAIPRPPVEPLPMAARIPVPGETLFIAGYGQGAFRLARGSCQGYAAPETGFPQEMIDISVAARQGDSGGPIVNDQGQLAGVLFGSGHGLTTGTHVGRLRQFLATLSADIPTSDPLSPDQRSLAGQVMTSHREAEPQPEPQSKAVPDPNPKPAAEPAPPPTDVLVATLPSMPAVTLGERADRAADPVAEVGPRPPPPLEPTAALAGGMPPLGPPVEPHSAPWKETQAFLIFLAAIGVVLLVATR